MQPGPYRNQRAAFTLVQILIVIAILVSLAALLFPVFSRVREKGRQMACQQNLRQIHLGVQLYVQDQDGHFPRLGTWDSDLASYIKDPAVFLCPTQTHPHSNTDWRLERHDYHLNHAQLNDFLNPMVNGRFVGGEMKVGGTNEARLEQTSRLIMFWEQPHDGKGREVPLPASCGNLTLADGRPDSKPWPIATIHSGGGNILFLDGHVKWFTPEDAANAICVSFNNGPVSPLFRPAS